MEHSQYPRVTNYEIFHRGPRVHQHTATIELDESRAFDVSCVSPNDEEDPEWLLKLYVQEWPPPDTRTIEERLTALETKYAILAAYVNTMPVPEGAWPEDCHRAFQESLED